MRRYEDLSSEAGWSDEVSSDKRRNGLFNQSPLAISFYSFSEETQEVVSTLRIKAEKNYTVSFQFTMAGL